ncbi:MAG: serine hydrolase [Pseudomonadota bacterium]
MTAPHAAPPPFERAWAAVRETIESGALCGGVLGVWPGNAASPQLAAAGYTDDTQKKAITPEAWFDLASLTKVLLTTPWVLRFIHEGRFALDTPLGDVLPDLRQVYAQEKHAQEKHAQENDPRRALTIEQLLSHQSGLPAWFPLYTYGADPARLRAFILQRAWPLGEAVYSDVNFMVLGILIERMRGAMMADDKGLWDVLPAGLAASPPDEVPIAATELCPWRGRCLRGDVHDENAYALGGLAGHAGAFGCAMGVLSAARALLAGQSLPAPVVATMMTPRPAGFALGWRVSEPWVFHTGFTGTSVHMDPVRGDVWCLLSNRIHPSRHRAMALQDLRSQVAAVLAGASS